MQWQHRLWFFYWQALAKIMKTTTVQRKGRSILKVFFFVAIVTTLTHAHIHFVYLHWPLKVLNIGLSNSQHRELNWEFEASRTRLANTRQLQTAVKKSEEAKFFLRTPSFQSAVKRNVPV